MRPTPPLLRCAALAALLLSECAGLSVRFDTGTARNAASGWVGIALSAPQGVRFGIVAIAAALVFGGRRMLDALQGPTLQFPLGSRWRTLLALHVGALGGFYWLTGEFLEDGRAAGEQAGVWLAGCVVAASAWLGSWALCLLPPQAWRRIAVAGRGGLASGLVVGAIVWLAGQFATRLWASLAASTFWCVNALLSPLYDDLVCLPDEFVIGTSRFSVRIAPECSGYEGVGLVLAFLLGYLWFDRRHLRFPRTFVLLPIGVAAAWLINSARIAALVSIGASWSESIALGGFHSQAGWLAFIAISLGLVAVAGRSQAFASNPAPAIAGARSNPAAPYLLPFLAALAASMISAAFSEHPETLYPLRALAALAVLAYFRRRYAVSSWNWSWPPLAVGTAVFVVWTLLAPATAGADPTSDLPSGPAVWSTIWLASRVAGYVCITPVIEELAFRGFLLRRIIAADFESVPSGTFTWRSLLISSVCFGALHGSLWIAGSLAGAAYAFALYRRRSLGDSIAAHATTNLMLAVYAMVTGEWSFFS